MSLSAASSLAMEDGREGSAEFVTRLHKFRLNILRTAWKVNGENGERAILGVCSITIAASFVTGWLAFEQPIPFFFLSILLGAIAVTDYLTEMIPDSLTVFAGAAMLCHAWFNTEGFIDELWLSVPMAVLMLGLGRIPAVFARIGYGDVKLLAAMTIGLGAFWGSMAMLAGAILGVGSRIITKNRDDAPYGQCIAIGSIIICIAQSLLDKPFS